MNLVLSDVEEIVSIVDLGPEGQPLGVRVSHDKSKLVSPCLGSCCCSLRFLRLNRGVSGSCFYEGML